ncbi:MAG: TetR/AcrR family transcriptional regulator [Flavobacteriaceae bacterium]|nr:TetR/AcrR family transcriptional regulator [Flavobacteriaceae bacterium]
MTMAMKTETMKTDILAAYTQHALEHEAFPTSVYKFCKENKIEETDFYATYASLDSVKHAVWQAFYDNASSLLAKNESHDSLSRKDRLLTFFYTFFEVLLLNRSYVLFALNENAQPMKNLGQLKQLRASVKDFATALIEEGNEDKSRFTQNPTALFAEATWGQLIFLMKFWMNDNSASFEKTDALIEKSVTVAFEVFDNTRLDTLLDLGKFLWKETTGKA